MNTKEFAPIYEELKSSGISRRAYCKKHNLKEAIIAYWYRKFENLENPIFEEITEEEVSVEKFELQLKSGRSLSIPNNFDPSKLQKLLKVLD